MHRYLLSALLALSLSGCVQRSEPRVRVPPPPPEVPTANLPGKLHELNWVDRSGAGSCVHASTLYVMRWQGQYQLAEYWRKNYAGGETAQTITNFYSKNHLPFACTFNGDPAFLVWASETRRAAIIWWKPYHCCAFVGISVIGGQEYAVIQDNNRPGTFEKTPLKEFIYEWRKYGGFACTLILTPPQSPIPWPSSVPREYFDHE